MKIALDSINIDKMISYLNKYMRKLLKETCPMTSGNYNHKNILISCK